MRSKRSWKYPGKVLVIDDDFKSVQNFILDLSKKGIPVQYWDGLNDPPITTVNIRVIVLDLDFTKGIVTRGEPSFYQLAAMALSKVKGPYIVTILSTDYTDEDISELQTAVQNLPNTEINGFITAGATKEIDYKQLYLLIENEIQNNLIFKLILVWEKLLDSSKDEALSEFLVTHFGNAIVSFVKSMNKDVGTGCLPREFVFNMMWLVSRYMNTGLNYNELKNILDQVLNGEALVGDDLFLPNLRMYHAPRRGETIWTGDIFKIERSPNELPNKYWKYAILITPACDIAQSKADTYILCEGCSVDYKSIQEKEHPYHKLNKDFKLPPNFSSLQDPEKKETFRNRIKKNRLQSQRGYLLWNFKNSEGEYVGICFDFQRIKFLNSKSIMRLKRKRMCRLDSPFIEDLLQRYGSYSTRLGVPSINSIN